MTQYARVGFQLYDQDGIAINSSGGAVTVLVAGTAHKATLYDKNGVAAANPVVLTTGGAEFYVASTVATVDLAIQAPHGQFENKKSVVVGGSYQYSVDTENRSQYYIIPFSISDCSATVEKDTGYVLPATAQTLDRLSGCGVRVTTLESGKTIDVGILESGGAGGGDANGLIAGTSLTNAVQVIGTNGALYSSNAPFLAGSVTEKKITYTLSSATTVAEGFIILPVVLELS